MDPNKLLDACLEIEGLLTLMASRGNTLPDNALALLKSKTAEFNCSVQSLACACAEDGPDVDRQIAESAMLEETEDAMPDNGIPEPVADETEAVPDDEPEQKPEGDGSEQTPAPVAEETVSRNETFVPLRFSVNDRFRFRRELFNFSDEEMDEAIEVAGQMNTVEEVEDYFYNDLCWDPDNEEVADFMKIIKARFAGKR